MPHLGRKDELDSNQYEAWTFRPQGLLALSIGVIYYDNEHFLPKWKKQG